MQVGVVKEIKDQEHRVALNLLYASLTIPLVYCSTQSLRRSIQYGEVRTQRRKDDSCEGLVSRGTVQRWDRVSSRVRLPH
jgi:hypothetical protein